MNRQQKSELIDFLKQGFADAPAAFLVGYKGISVAKIQTLRKKLRQNDASFKVAKNRLARRAVAELDGVQDLSGLMKEQLAIVFAHKDPSAVAKILHEFSKEHQALALVGGCVERKVVNKDGVVVLASLPSREVLLGHLAGTLQAPISTYARLLNAILARLAYALQAVAEEKQKNS